VARLNKKNSDTEIQHYTRQGLLLTAVIALLLIWSAPSIVALWYNLGSVFIPPLLLPVLAVLYPRLKISNKATFVNLLTAFIMSVAWLLTGQLLGRVLWGIQPFIPGMTLSIFIYGYALLKKRKVSDQQPLSGTMV